MHFEQLTKLALTQRQIVNALACPKINHVPGSGLWPRAVTEITCKNYNRKPLQVESEKVARSHYAKRDKREHKTVRTFDASQLAAMNDEYVALINAMALRRDRALLIGEARR